MRSLGLFDFLLRRRGSSDRLRPGRTTSSVTLTWGTQLSPYRSRTANILEELRRIDDEADAVDFLAKKNPDVSMAVWNFIRLANQGNEMAFYGVNARNKGRRITALEDDWREFAARINSVSNAGLDGLINQLHYSAFALGAQGLEVEIARTLDDIVDVYPVDPRTILWEYDKEQQVWVPYQQQAMKKVSLADANFFWVPSDPDIDDPRGNLMMGSVLQAIDFQMQVLQDLQAVIHNQGWPRYDITILLERVMASMPPQVRMDPKKAKEWLENRRDEVEEALRELKPDDSFVHFDDSQIKKVEGGEVTRSVDVRAISEMLDAQTMSGLKQQGVLMNRISGSTETWSTVQFRIFVTGLLNVQRGSKRLIEEVARLWLRVKGIQAIPVFEHRTIDWQSERDKVQVKLMWQQFYAIAQLLGWISPDEAASEAVGREGAYSQMPSEVIRVSFNLGGDLIGRSNDPGRSSEAKLGGNEATERPRVVPLFRSGVD